MLDRIKAWWRRRSAGERDNYDTRVDTLTVARFDGGESGAIPPNYVRTGVDEGRPKK
jgi:hypothetical protein